MATPNSTNHHDAEVEALSEATLKPRVVAADYAVRGELVRRAAAIEAEIAAARAKAGGKASSSPYPFDRLVWCNIGNPQILGQRPITFFRQVLSLLEYPALLDDPLAPRLFPADALERARRYLGGIPGGLGAYSDSAGALVLREEVAAAIAARDGGVAADADDIFLTDGASPGVHYLMEMLLRDESDAVLVPIPQYPLYSATLTLYGGTLLGYELDEDAGWALDAAALRRQVAGARERGLRVRALVVINPGNPTGQVLSYANQVDVVRLCADQGLVLIADEVYQANVYAAGATFTSFKKVLRELGSYSCALASLHSTSKGFIGECGRRGGYVELVNFPDDVRAQVLKLASINLCPNVSGQVAVALMMAPPRPGEPSYAQYVRERDDVLGSLARRASALVAALNALPGITCNEAQGALYAFPRLHLPPAALAAAAAARRAPDFFYCAALLEATGIVVVPGSGFGQAAGTSHFRTTFLPPEADMAGVVARLGEFHRAFMAQFGGEGGGGEGK